MTSNFFKIGTIDDFTTARFKTVKLFGRLITVVREEDGSFFAIESSCKHQGADLFVGYQGGNQVTCHRHQWVYDLRTGECLTHDSLPLRRYQVVVEDANVLVSLYPEESGNGTESGNLI